MAKLARRRQQCKHFISLGSLATSVQQAFLLDLASARLVCSARLE